MSSAMIKPPTVRTSIHLGTFDVGDINQINETWISERNALKNSFQQSDISKQNETTFSNATERSFNDFNNSNNFSNNFNNFNVYEKNTPENEISKNSNENLNEKQFVQNVKNEQIGQIGINRQIRPNGPNASFNAPLNASLAPIESLEPITSSSSLSMRNGHMSLLHDSVLNSLLEQIKSLDTSKITKNNESPSLSDSTYLNTNINTNISANKPLLRQNSSKNVPFRNTGKENVESSFMLQNYKQVSPNSNSSSISIGRESLGSNLSGRSASTRRTKRQELMNGRLSMFSVDSSFRPELAVKSDVPGPMDYSPNYDAVLTRSGGTLKNFGTQNRFQGSGSYLNFTNKVDISGGLPQTPSDRDRRGGPQEVKVGWLSNFDYVNNNVHQHTRYSEHWKQKLERYKDQLKDKPIFSWLMDNHFSRFGWGKKKPPGQKYTRRIYPDIEEAAGTRKYLFSDKSLERKAKFINRETKEEPIKINPYSSNSAYSKSSLLDKFGRLKKTNTKPQASKKVKVKVSKVPDRYVTTMKH